VHSIQVVYFAAYDRVIVEVVNEFVPPKKKSYIEHNYRVMCAGNKKPENKLLKCKKRRNHARKMKV